MIPISKSAPSIQIPPDTYVARCYSMVHIGTVSYEWGGEQKSANKVRITFEFPTATHVFKEGEEEKPFVLSAEYTLSLGEKSRLRPQLEAWRGKKFTDEEIGSFDITKLVGVPAMVTVIQNEKGYSEIAQISKLPKGMECPAQINASVILDYDENWSKEKFEKLPEFIRKKMESTPEYKNKNSYPTDKINPDEIPF